MCEVNPADNLDPATILPSPLQEVAEWRAQSKAEAKQLGFKPNKKAVVHPLNQSTDVAKDPRSMNQASQWDAPKMTKLVPKSISIPLSLVIDIMEGRRIGMEELPTGMCNYVALKLEVLKSIQGRSRTVLQVDDGKEPMFSMFSDSRGSSRSRWIDSFHMSAFPVDSIGMVTGTPYLRLTIKQGTLEKSEDPQTVFEACQSKEIKINLTFEMASTVSHLLQPVVLTPTWYQWRTGRGANDDAFIKITAQLVETAKIPSMRDFLPYTEWPPMVLHTNKSRLDLMMEEEEEEEEQVFKGNLGSQLVSYNPATLPRILGVFAGDYNRDFLLAFGLVMGAPLIDRTGTLAVAKYDFAPDPLDPDRRLKALPDHDCHHDLHHDRHPDFHQGRQHDLDHHTYRCHHLSDWCLLKGG